MFDSGFGGLTVARAVIDLLPHEDVVYVAPEASSSSLPARLFEQRGLCQYSSVMDMQPTLGPNE